MLSTVYHKKASVLKIPLTPPLPKGDNKDDSHIFMRFLPTHLSEDPKLYLRANHKKAKLRLFTNPSSVTDGQSLFLG
jgi:hypothetical protein